MQGMYIDLLKIVCVDQSRNWSSKPQTPALVLVALAVRKALPNKLFVMGMSSAEQ